MAIGFVPYVSLIITFWKHLFKGGLKSSLFKKILLLNPIKTMRIVLLM